MNWETVVMSSVLGVFWFAVGYFKGVKDTTRIAKKVMEDRL